MAWPAPRPFDVAASDAARAHLDRQAKPPGGLGKLESLLAWWCGATGGFPARSPAAGRLYAFAGDHGVTAHGVSAYTSAMTARMVRNVLSGHAAVNAFARQHGVDVAVVDVGVGPAIGDIGPLVDTEHGRFYDRNVRRGTADMAIAPAMGRADAEAAVQAGVDLAVAAAEQGIAVVGAGEVGVGGSTAAAACLAAVSGMPGKLCAGRGSGIDDAGLRRKIDAIDRALALHRPERDDGIGILAAVGGLEVAAIAGLCLGGAAHGVPVVLDGFASTAGGLIASVIDRGVLDHLVVAHRSAENGHWAMARSMGKEPIHDLDLLVGEGAGAILGIDSIRLAVRVAAELATAEGAGVSGRS
jgi:nicotinate-nucleotide--dimethylbenzimidazole phosphoribosyltransferase